MQQNKKWMTAGLLFAAITATTGVSAQEDKAFDGVYAGVEAGVDWTRLAGNGDRSFYYGGVLGYRHQGDSGLVLGLEGTFGDTGYDEFANSNYELGGSLILGSTFGRDQKNLIFSKVGYVRQNFDVDFQGLTSSTQEGLRLGGGFERSLGGGLSFRTGVDYTTYGDGLSQWQAKGGLLLKF